MRIESSVFLKLSIWKYIITLLVINNRIDEKTSLKAAQEGIDSIIQDDASEVTGSASH